MARKTAPRPAYDVHPGVAMVQKWAADLPARTGRSLDQWAELIRRSKLPAKEKRAWLKAEHGHGTNTAWWLVEYAEGSATWDVDPDAYLASAAGYVEAMYAGGKAALRPVFDKLLRVGRSLGKDVKVCPCKTMVPFYRKRVFAEIKPATRTRIDLSLALGEEPEAGKLKVNQQRVKRGDRLTHLIALATPDDVDAEVTRWLRAAYDRDAG
jgi:hypothetical protein